MSRAIYTITIGTMITYYMAYTELIELLDIRIISLKPFLLCLLKSWNQFIEVVLISLNNLSSDYHVILPQHRVKKTLSCRIQMTKAVCFDRVRQTRNREVRVPSYNENGKAYGCARPKKKYRYC